MAYTDCKQTIETAQITITTCDMKINDKCVILQNNLINEKRTWFLKLQQKYIKNKIYIQYI